MYFKMLILSTLKNIEKKKFKYIFIKICIATYILLIFFKF